MANFLPYERQFTPGRHLDELGRTVLWHAMCAGSAPEVRYLIRSDRAALSIGDINCMTPLHAACCLGHAEVASTLIKSGASLNVTTAAPGLMAAHFAAGYNHPDCLEELITYGADVHKSTDTGAMSFRPIHLAAANRHLRSFHILRDANSNMGWRCSHYILRSANFDGGKCQYRSEVVDCDMSVMDLFRKHWD